VETLGDILESLANGLIDFIFSVLLNSFNAILLPLLESIFGVGA